MGGAHNPEIANSIVANGIKTNYHDVGSGKPVLLIHGSGPGVTGWANWRLTIPVLAEHSRVIVPDMVGFGFTERPAGIRYPPRVLQVRHLAMLEAEEYLPIPRVEVHRDPCPPVPLVQSCS